MIRLRRDVIFDNPECRIREYCDIEIYHGYDNRHNVTDAISIQDIKVANKLYAMKRFNSNQAGFA